MRGGTREFGYDFILLWIGQLPVLSRALIKSGPVFAGPVISTHQQISNRNVRIRMKSRRKLGRKFSRGDRDRAQLVLSLDQDEALDDALKNTFPASDPVSIVQPAPTANFDRVKSSKAHGMDEREAFWAAVYKLRSPKWSPALPDQPTFEVKGKHLTIRQVCELVKDIPDELPYIVAGEMVKAMRGDPKLIQLFALSRTYATGSQCLLELLGEHVTRQRNGSTG